MVALASALQLAASLRKGQVGALELLETCFSAVDRYDQEVNAVVYRDEEGARRQAEAWQARLSRGDDDLPPFAGVPLPIKDLVAVAGWPLTYGSEAVAPTPSATDDLAVERLRKAGFVLCARTNTPELGTLTVTENRRYGITRNPWDLERSPGGSSGGAAAAVAAEMFPLAHASDGGGSIRIPASCCGLVGLKPSRGRVPSMGPGWLGLAAEGVLSRTVADTAVALDCLAGPDARAWYGVPSPEEPFACAIAHRAPRVTVGLLLRPPLEVPVAEEPANAARHAASLLESLGHEVVEVDVEPTDAEAIVPFLTVMNAGLGELEGIDWSRVEPHNALAYQAAIGTDSLSLVRSLTTLQRLSAEQVTRWGKQFDVLLTPTMASGAPPAGQVGAELAKDPTATPYEAVAMAAFTAMANLTGQPAISLPLGWDEGGHPVGVQLVGPPLGEDLLLALAADLEAVAPWAGRRPPLLGGDQATPLVA